MARIIVKCAVCGKDKAHTFYRVKMGLGKYCSSECSQIAQKGRKLPHTAEWEKKRLAASRLAIKQRGYVPTGRKPTLKVQNALRKWRKENPQKSTSVSLQNLPKDCAGPKNGNWKGGITLVKRGIRFCGEYLAWKRIVRRRDGNKCRLCNATCGLHVHHIIPISKEPDMAFMPANGVTLCEAHHKENDECWTSGVRYKPRLSEIPAVRVFFIDHRFQEYPTCGNWKFTSDNKLVIFVSKTGDWRSDNAVALHEMAEALMCRAAGILEKEVDEFDMAFEAQKNPNDDREPGLAEGCPYRRQHILATAMEQVFIENCGVPWERHEAAVANLK